MTKSKAALKKQSPKDIGKQTASTKKKVKIKTGPNKRGKAEASKATQFKPGNKLGGRKLGSRNKFAEQFLSDFLTDWEQHGAEAIVAVRSTDPSTYIRVGASLVPRELNVNENDKTLERLLEQFNIGELSNLIAGLEQLGAGSDRSIQSSIGQGQNETEAGSQPDSLH